MSFTRSLSVLMIGLQVGMVSIASAATPAAAVPSPEFKMLKAAIAYQGMSLPNDQLSEKLSAVVNGYLASAQQAGQSERFQAALVQLGIYNATEAANFMADTQNTVPTQDEIRRLASLHPVGSQFSSCAAETTGLILTLTGGLVFVIGYFGPTYSSPTQMCDGILCSQEDYYHSTQYRQNELIISGVATAIGVILLATTQGSC